jgi:hypothetical protein
MERASRSAVYGLGIWLCWSVTIASCVREPRVVGEGADATPIAGAGGSNAAAGGDPVLESLAATRPLIEHDTPRDYYELELARTNGAVRLVSVTRLQRRVRPFPNFAADYYLVSRSAKAILEAVPVSFPRHGHGTLVDSNGLRSHVDMDVPEGADGEVSAVVSADSAIDHLELVGPGDTVLFRVDAKDLPPRPGESRVGVQVQALNGAETLAQSFPNIIFVTPGWEALVRSGLHGGTIVEFSPEAVRGIRAGLSKLPPAVLNAVQTIAVVKLLAEEAHPDAEHFHAGHTRGPRVVLSDELTEAMFEQTIIHEAAHTLDELTIEAATGVRTNPDQTYRPQVIEAGRELVAKFSLLTGIRGMFETLQQSGVDTGSAVAYGSNWTGASPEKLARSGFITIDGTAVPQEDYAEYVSGLARLDSSQLPALCRMFSNANAQDKSLLLPYAKLIFLRAIEAVSLASFKACVQGFMLEPTQSGISFVGVGNLDRELNVSLGAVGDQNEYSISGAGPESYRVVISVPVGNPPTPPRGLFRFADVGPETGEGIHQLTRVALLHDKMDLHRASKDGLLLITRSDASHAEGAMFGLRLRKDSGAVTDSFPMVRFKVP